jgi:diguanylate cyclase (GGDEF)-like protein/putative nucleotidyltransferase with HDIG domain
MRPAKRMEDLERQLGDAQRQIAELERSVERAGLRDHLTGLPTLQAFGRRLEVEVERSRRHDRALTIALVDLDVFGAVNLAHGMGTGDAVLRAVGRALSSSTRETDVVTRAGADEFALLLAETSAAEAQRVLERLLVQLETIRVGPVEAVSASIGYAEYRRPMRAEELLAAAGEALAVARREGGGRVQLKAEAAEPSAGPGPMHQDAVAGLAGALLERDRYTGEHSEEVLGLVEQVARGLALEENEVQRIRFAALLHDIGKVAIPDDILHKPGPLDDRELSVMREHSAIGERIVRSIPGLGNVARIVRHEHERWDGEGYPDGLRGEEIPVGARIILACDAYHAMISDRPYRKAMSHSEAIRELAVNAGTQFDPTVTELLIGCLYGSPRREPVTA